MPAPFKQIHGVAPDLERIQGNVAEALAKVGGLLKDAVLLPAVVLPTYGSGTLFADVPHGLGRKPIGFICVGQHDSYPYPLMVFDGGQADNPHPEETIRLACYKPVGGITGLETFDILVF